MSIEQRKYPRYPCNLNISVRTENHQSWQMIALDISVKGLRIISKDFDVLIEPQSFVEISLEKHLHLPALTLSGEVKHYSYEENGQVVFGVEITKIDDEAKEKWHQLIELIRKQSLSKAM